MHLRHLACAVVSIALLTCVSPTGAQIPIDPAPDRAAATPLITEPPAIPAANKESITAAENAVLAAHDASIAAAEALDLDTLFSFLVPTNRGAMIAGGRITLTQDDVMTTTRRDFAGLSSIRYAYTRRHVTLLSLTSAIIVGEGNLHATTRDGGKIDRPFAQTIVFMRVGDAWKVIHLHSSTPLAGLGG